jgi:hypothetical protein
MRHQTTFHHVVLLRFGVAAVALAALLGWGVSGSAAAVGAPSARPLSTHAVGKRRSGTSESITGMVADQRIASDARLRLSDLPPGWMGQNTATRLTADAPCPGLRRAASDISAGKISPIFSDGGVRTAQSETYVYADIAMAKHWFAEFTSRSTRACLARLLREELAATVLVPGVNIGPITVRGISVAPVGDQDSAFRITVPVSGSGVHLKVDADAVFVRTGRGIAIFSLGKLGSPFDPSLEHTLIKTVVDRLAADLRRAP